jgi:phosphate starvation-inducible membrane PsiE
MISQLYAILLLKWWLMRNSWSSHSLLSIITGIILVLVLLPLAVLLSIGGYFLGFNAILTVPPVLRLMLLDAIVFGFLFFWMLALLTEVQRNDPIDLRKLFYLPVRLPALFFFNYVAALLSFSLALFLPAMCGLVFGLHARQPLPLPLGLALVGGFVLMMGAIAYYFRGVFAAAMQNARRRRAMALLIPLLIIGVSQLPFMISRLARPGESDEIRAQLEAMLPLLELGNQALPVGWMPLGLWSLTEGDRHTALLCAGGLAAASLIILVLAYRSTLRFYLHGAGSATPRRSRPQRTPLTLRPIPFVGGDTAAMALASFLVLRRHPVVRLSFISTLAFGVFLYVIASTSRSNEPGIYGLAGSSQLMWVLWPFLGFSNIMFNHFGFDRGSFRALILLPSPRHRYLLAKNLALFPMVAGTAACFAAVGSQLMRPDPALLLLGALQILQLYLAMATAGNWMSLYFPYQVSNDPLRNRQKRPFLILVGFAGMLVLALLAIPAGLCLLLHNMTFDWWHTPFFSPGIALAAVLLLLSIPVYVWGLVRAGDVLLDREQKILELLIRDRD